MATMRNYSLDEYRNASINAGPFVLESNPHQHYRTNRRTPILLAVMHITAGHSDWVLPDTSAEGTTRYGMTTDRVAAWHVCLDSDGIIPAIRDEWTAFHAGATDIANTNDCSLGMEIGTGDTNWTRKPVDWVERTLRLAAAWWAPRVIKYGIPLRVERSRSALIASIIARRKIGFCGHHLITPASRTDPGLVQGVDTFPWERFFVLLREEIALRKGIAPTPAPQEEDDMFSDTDRATLNAISKALAAHDSEEDGRYQVESGRYQHLARLSGGQVDPDELAGKIAAALPASDSVTKDALAAALREVLGSLDTTPEPTPPAA